MDARRILRFLVGVMFSASVVLAEGQVGGVAVRHRLGQTFVTWEEVSPAEIEDGIDCAALKGLLKEMDADSRVRYRIYRSDKEIESVEGMAPIAEVGPASCWNSDYYGIYPKKGQAAHRYVAVEGESPLAHGVGIYVHNPGAAGEGHYAVTFSKAGMENKSIGPDNTTGRAVREIRGQGAPVLQRIVRPGEFAYIKGPELHYYVRWEAPPNASIENKPIDYLVAIPPEIAERPTPVGLHLHCWGGSLDGGYGWWYSYGRGGSTYLVSSNQTPYDWWTGYHELYYSGPASQETWKEGVVRSYTTRRMLSFLDWAAEKYELDMNRVFTAGSSMGGSGAPMFAIRHSDRIAWSIGWVGVHDPGNTPQFLGSYERVYGKKDWGIEHEDGAPAFEHFKDASYLRRHPRKEIGFITWSNGKNDGGIGWPQAVEFYRAMQETHRPHIFVWGLGGHGQRAKMPSEGGERIMPLDIRLDQSLPAFTGCSVDDDPGTARKLDATRQVISEGKTRADSYDGDSAGQVNLYLYWDTEDVVDKADRWEMTVALTSNAPKDECTVDITPRRLQHLRSASGRKFGWTNVCEGKKIQTGRATADQWGLITLPKVIVSKKQNRISIFR